MKKEYVALVVEYDNYSELAMTPLSKDLKIMGCNLAGFSFSDLIQENHDLQEKLDECLLILNSIQDT